jgi:uncharacterized protein with HEPN domain
MARAALAHLEDILAAIRRIRQYTRGGETAFRKSAMARDAVIARLIQIGQAAKDAQDAGLELAALAPQVPWRSVAGMRDRLVHKYWDADHAIVWNVVANELGKLENAVKALLAGKARGAAVATATRGKPARRKG